MKPLVRPLVFAGITAILFLAAGCDSPSHKSADREPPAERPVALRGEAVFFDGKLLAQATVSRGRPIAFAAGDGEAGGHRHGGSGGGGGRGGHRHGGGGGDMEASTPRRSDEDDSGDPVVHMRASSLPAVTLRLRLQNTSKESLEVQIDDVKSDLGDFAVRPERLLLAPDQAAEVDPMVSQLGATSDEIPVTLVLRVGGKTETHDLRLKNILPPPPAPPSIESAPPPAEQK